VDGGIGSLAAAAFMIRDGDVPGEDITIFEAAPLMGGRRRVGGKLHHRQLFPRVLRNRVLVYVDLHCSRSAPVEDGR
jgi:myosin-crossreactive antigen